MKPVKAALLAALLVALTALPGCGSKQPVVVSRQALGTIVTITAYGADEAALRKAADAAFADMARVEKQLDSYDARSDVAAINRRPFEWHPLPPAAVRILDRIGALGVASQFSPALFAVTKLYDFSGKGSVPTTAALARGVAESRGLRREGDRSCFLPLPSVPPGPLPAGSADGTKAASGPGLDFGGAAKGLAIDQAMAGLVKADAITGAMISAGSSTRVWGRKPDGSPWRIGIEDPREVGKVVAVVGSVSPRVLNVSTSGDYQQYFERDGMRYHHILDPRTGAPARGLRSLTVYGSLSGVDADILSTALFVMGPQEARSWAKRHGVGLYAVDDRGGVIAVPPVKGSSVTFERPATPKR